MGRINTKWPGRQAGISVGVVMSCPCRAIF
jgi:hypothetical protein